MSANYTFNCEGIDYTEDYYHNKKNVESEEFFRSEAYKLFDFDRENGKTLGVQNGEDQLENRETFKLYSNTTGQPVLKLMKNFLSKQDQWKQVEPIDISEDSEDDKNSDEENGADDSFDYDGAMEKELAKPENTIPRNDNHNKSHHEHEYEGEVEPIVISDNSENDEDIDYENEDDDSFDYDGAMEQELAKTDNTFPKNKGQSKMHQEPEDEPEVLQIFAFDSTTKPRVFKPLSNSESEKAQWGPVEPEDILEDSEVAEEENEENEADDSFDYDGAMERELAKSDNIEPKNKNQSKMHQKDENEPVALRSGKRKSKAKTHRKSPYQNKSWRIRVYPPSKKDAAVIKKWDGNKLPVGTEQKQLGITYTTLCILACVNSPTGWVHNNDIYCFCLHHWSYFRTTPINWRANIRKALSEGDEVFEKMIIERDGKLKTHFSLKHEDLKIYRPKEMEYICKVDRRGLNFYKRLMNGEIGLPRQLFYFIIGLPAMKYAGPENSALFYHLLSIGIIPEANSDHIFSHSAYDVIFDEPKFEEPQMEFTLAMMSDINNLTSYRVNLINGEPAKEWSIDMSNWFYDNLSQYFKIQNNCKQNGWINWETPSISVHSDDDENQKNPN